MAIIIIHIMSVAKMNKKENKQKKLVQPIHKVLTSENF